MGGRGHARAPACEGTRRVTRTLAPTTQKTREPIRFSRALSSPAARAPPLTSSPLTPLLTGLPDVSFGMLKEVNTVFSASRMAAAGVEERATTAAATKSTSKARRMQAIVQGKRRCDAL